MSFLAKFVLCFASLAAIISCILVVRKGHRQAVPSEQSPEIGEFFDEFGTLTAESDNNEAVEAIQTNQLISVDPVLNEEETIMVSSSQAAVIFTVHVFAKDKQQFVGYELLQAILAAGLRFGEMDIFHRYQSLSGKGPILFSLACAMEPGTFEIQKMGGFACPGLSLFLRLSGNPTIDNERFELLMETAEQLQDDLDGELRDHERKLLSEQTLADYKREILAQEGVKVTIEEEQSA